MDKKRLLLIFILVLVALVGIALIIKGYNATPSLLKLDLSSIKINSTQILGIIVSIVVLLALVVFLFVRFQAVKRIT